MLLKHYNRHVLFNQTEKYFDACIVQNKIYTSIILLIGKSEQLKSSTIRRFGIFF